MGSTLPQNLHWWAPRRVDLLSERAASWGWTFCWRGEAGWKGKVLSVGATAGAVDDGRVVTAAEEVAGQGGARPEDFVVIGDTWDNHALEEVHHFPISAGKWHFLKKTSAEAKQFFQMPSSRNILSTKIAPQSVRNVPATKSQYSTSHVHMWVCTW